MSKLDITMAQLADKIREATGVTGKLSLDDMRYALENNEWDINYFDAPEGVSFIDRSLTSITIPNSVTSIGIDAFRGCTSLTSITIPNSVTRIGIDAFRGCTSLTNIYCNFAKGTVPDAPWGATNATIHYNNSGK